MAPTSSRSRSPRRLQRAPSPPASDDYSQILPAKQVTDLISKLNAQCTSSSSAVSLRDMLADSLPTKSAFLDQWLAVLGEPSVCITTVDDVRGLHDDDIAALPVPPVVKSLFRRLRDEAAAKKAQQQDVLLSTMARATEFLRLQTDRKGEPFHSQNKSDYFQDVDNYRLVLTREEISTGVHIVASRIEKWCKTDRIVLVGVLTGAFVFLADLCRALKRPYSVVFIKASSYEDEKQQGNLRFSLDVKTSKFVGTDGKPKKVILVDELLDNGKTLELLRQHFVDYLKASHTASDVITCCLFTKKRSREYPVANICGIPNLPDLWVNGYGLDDRESKRGWSELFATPKTKIIETIKKSDTEMLLDAMDEDGKMTRTLKIAGFELAHKHPRLQVVSVDGLQVQSKTHLVSVLNKVEQGMNGYYNHEVRISFVAEGLHLVREDEIFQGNETAYAEMRCALRDQLAADALTTGVPFFG